MPPTVNLLTIKEALASALQSKRPPRAEVFLWWPGDSKEVAQRGKIFPGSGTIGWVRDSIGNATKCPDNGGVVWVVSAGELANGVVVGGEWCLRLVRVAHYGGRFVNYRDRNGAGGRCQRLVEGKQP